MTEGMNHDGGSSNIGPTKTTTPLSSSQKGYIHHSILSLTHCSTQGKGINMHAEWQHETIRISNEITQFIQSYESAF